jgi:hypothetical protein
VTNGFKAPAGTAWSCETCGVQFPESESQPESCPICEDFRQFVGLDGQRWTRLDEMRTTHKNQIGEIAPGILSIHTQPKFAIGQRALVVKTPAFNVLWDCVTQIDDATVAAVREFGGISAIAISHPHYYSTMAEWSAAFGGVPIYIHEADRAWVMRMADPIEFWSGETKEIGGGLTLIRCGGHFEGAQVMHAANSHQYPGTLFAGDVIQVCPDRRWVSFMRSYPNYIPLPETSVRAIVESVEPFEFDRVYGAWPKFEVMTGAKEAVRRSAERYVRALKEVIG